ncbi:MAG: pre-peptidase C-terminal domain-containing protein, partial [Planctomycetota bacterium]
GAYTVQVILNAAVEMEEHDGGTNDDLASAETIAEASFVSLGGGAARAAVVGTLPSMPGAPVLVEDFESGGLGGDWTTYSTGNGRVRVLSTYGAADGSTYSLLLDSSTISWAANEAIWTVDLSGVTDATLTFWHAKWLPYEEEHTFVGDFVDHYNADGVAISEDGTNWHPVFNAPSQSEGVWQQYSIDLAAEAAGHGIALGSGFQIKFQQYDNDYLAWAGRGYDEIEILVPAPAEDWYEFTLTPGQSVTLALTALTGGPVDLELRDGGGALVTAGFGGASNVDRVIENFVSTGGGTYYARVMGNDSDYTLVVTRNATFDVEPNDVVTSAQEIGPGDVALGEVGSTDNDYYVIYVAASDDLTISTATPADGAGEFVNVLDPAIELYGTNDLLVVGNDNGAPDGRNALIFYPGAGAGTYKVRVYPSAGTTGEYVLTVEGATGAPPPFEVVSTDPADGIQTHASISQVTVDFSHEVLLSSLDASDLTIDAATAFDVTPVDADTAIFIFSGSLGEGTHDLEIGAGAITDLRGEPIEPFTAQVTILPPFRVTSSTIPEGGTVAAGPLAYSVGFKTSRSWARSRVGTSPRASSTTPARRRSR